jgi:hypothetical protein
MSKRNQAQPQIKSNRKGRKEGAKAAKVYAEISEEDSTTKSKKSKK